MNKKINDNGLSAGLYIVATPIGNLGDITERAVAALGAADYVACEDTRVSGKLLSLLGISVKLVPVHNFNEAGQVSRILGLIKEGASVALISDAGTPLINDPGFKLVRACREEGVFVTSVPGASALITALTLSGLPTNRFTFVGFVPAKTKAAGDFIRGFSSEKATVIFYETANRLLDTLAIIAEVMPNREICVARELTKMYETVRNGRAEELLAFYTANPAKGEIVGLVAPSDDPPKADWEPALALLREKLSAKDSAELIAKMFDIPKKEVYAKAIL